MATYYPVSNDNRADWWLNIALETIRG